MTGRHQIGHERLLQIGKRERLVVRADKLGGAGKRIDAACHLKGRRGCDFADQGGIKHVAKIDNARNTILRLWRNHHIVEMEVVMDNLCPQRRKARQDMGDKTCHKFFSQPATGGIDEVFQLIHQAMRG